MSKKIIILILIVVVIPFGYLGWKDLWNTFLETNPPTIQVESFPRGLGSSGKKCSFLINDNGAGIAGVVVRMIQRGRSIEVYRQDFNREKNTKIEFELSADQHKLIDGTAELEFRAFDASFWNNTELLEYSLKIDRRKPYIKVMSTQHNIRRSGSQLVIYEAIDDDLNIHGVKVGLKAYLGVPLKGIDRSFSGTNLYGAFFTVTNKDSENPIIKAFAEDSVGNSASDSFYYKLISSGNKNEIFRVNQSYLQSTVATAYKQNYYTMSDWAEQNAISLPPAPTNDLNLENLQSALISIHKILIPWSDFEIKKHFKNPRSEKLWHDAFEQPMGIVQSAYGHQKILDLNNQVIVDRFQTGYEIKGKTTVLAANSGIVSFTDSIGSYGKVIGIDHGAGLFSIYAWLKDSLVSVGENVNRGQAIAQAGGSGLSRGADYFYQLRLYDTPINPAEWWDRSWYLGHVVEKINDVKRKIGLPVLVGRLEE